MGFFRKYKQVRHSIEEVNIKLSLAKLQIIQICNQPNKHQLDSALYNWGCWRELKARLEGQNQSEVR